jgi:hypothetical protein
MFPRTQNKHTKDTEDTANQNCRYYTSCSIFPKNQLPAKLTVSNDFLAGSNGKQKKGERKK